MTMFIACLLIYHFNMDWWWYGVAAALWAIQLFFFVSLNDQTSRVCQFRETDCQFRKTNCQFEKTHCRFRD